MLVLAGALGALSFVTTASAGGRPPCPNVFEPVCCLSGGCFNNQCLADRAGAWGCWDIPVDPYPGPGGEEQ